MKATSIYVVSFLVFVGTANAQQNTTTLVTNLVQLLPHIESFARSLDLEMPLPITTNRVSQFRGLSRIAGARRSMGVSVDDRFGFTFDADRRLVYIFSDKRYSLGFLTQKLTRESVSPEIREKILKEMTVPPSITETQALAMACKYLVRLGYDVKRLPVGSPQIVQEKPFPIFTIEWPWTLDNPALEKPRPYFTIEIDGLRMKATSFLTLMASPAEDSLTNSPSSQSGQ